MPTLQWTMNASQKLANVMLRLHKNNLDWHGRKQTLRLLELRIAYRHNYPLVVDDTINKGAKLDS